MTSTSRDNRVASIWADPWNLRRTAAMGVTPGVAVVAAPSGEGAVPVELATAAERRRRYPKRPRHLRQRSRFAAKDPRKWRRLCTEPPAQPHPVWNATLRS